MTKVPKFSKDEIKFLSEATRTYFQMAANEVNQSVILNDSLGVQKKLSVGKSATEKMNDWVEEIAEEQESAE